MLRILQPHAEPINSPLYGVFTNRCGDFYSILDNRDKYLSVSTSDSEVFPLLEKNVELEDQLSKISKLSDSALENINSNNIDFESDLIALDQAINSYLVYSNTPSFINSKPKYQFIVYDSLNRADKSCLVETSYKIISDPSEELLLKTKAIEYLKIYEDDDQVIEFLFEVLDDELKSLGPNKIDSDQSAFYQKILSTINGFLQEKKEQIEKEQMEYE